ncbi:MAG: polyamine aminopropyltransferase [Deltaproteobacteria bacterium]|nr:polyamine aminopropyltransferase [Deltaproteobacteria bacterium]
MRQIIHIIAEYIGCQENRELFTNKDKLLEILKIEVARVGLGTVAEAGYSFGEGEGVTATLVLSESHLNIHTWPERDYYLNVDISVCNYSCENFPKALELGQTLKRIFNPIDFNEKIIKGYKDIEDDKYTEYFSKDYGFFIKPNEMLYKSSDDGQTVEVFETLEFGRLLRIDNYFQTSEKDEFIYHESLVHPAMVSHPNPEKVLIIGAGDGGVLNHVLKHNTVKKAVMVEIDETVIKVSKKYLENIHRNSFDDPRSEIIIMDGLKYIDECEERFDAVILDLTDPIGPARNLYTETFYANIKKTLKNKDSVLSLHTEYPFIYPDVFGRINKTLKKLFDQVTHGFSFVPLYGAVMSFGYCSDRCDFRVITKEEIQTRLQERGVSGLKLYNPEMHFSLIAEPNYIKEILAKNHEIITSNNDLEEFQTIYNVTRN